MCSQLVKKKNKTHRQRCNATITRVLNTSGANYKINLNDFVAVYKAFSNLKYKHNKFSSLLHQFGLAADLAKIPNHFHCQRWLSF